MKLYSEMGGVLYANVCASTSLLLLLLQFILLFLFTSLGFAEAIRGNFSVTLVFAEAIRGNFVVTLAFL